MAAVSGAVRRGLSDWTLPLATGLVLAIVTAAPYVYGYLAQPHGQVFLGFFYLGDDANTYLAKMRQGFEGAWSWQNRYTTEESPTAYLFMFWLLLGHIAAIAGLPLIVVFHLARVAAAFALMAAAWLCITHFIQDRGVRLFAFFFLAFGLGMGYVIQALGHPVVFGNPTDTLDWRMPELTAFYSILALPHFAWSGVFAALGIPLTLKAIERGDLRLGALAGLAWLGQASIHPQMPILMGGATAVAMLLSRPSTKQGWVAGALAFAIPAPYILYAYFAFIGNPEVQRWTFHSKNALPPEGFSFLFAIAPQLLLALVGIPGALRRRSREDLFLVAWLVLLAAILYLPNPAGDLRRRFLDALYIPLVILGARGMFEVILPRFRSARARRLIPFCVRRGGQRVPRAGADAGCDSAAVRDEPVVLRGPHLARRPAAGPRAVDAGHRVVCPGLFARHGLCRALRRDLRLLHEDSDRPRPAHGEIGHRGLRPGEPHPVRDLDLRPEDAATGRAGAAGLRHA